MASSIELTPTIRASADSLSWDRTTKASLLCEMIERGLEDMEDDIWPQRFTDASATVKNVCTRPLRKELGLDD